MEPSACVNDASIFERPITGSGTGPPHMPECSDCLRARTSTSTVTSPRSAVVIDGRPVSKFAVSVKTMASADSSARCCCRKAERCSEPTSSSPSMTTFTLSGSPPASRQASTALVCTTMPALSSAAPRAKRRPSRSVGSKGGDFHAASSPAGCTSWWAYSNSVGCPGALRTSP